MPGDGSANPIRRAAAQGQLVADWRYVVGTFAMRIPVRQERAILPEEEDLLAILKWRLSIVSSVDRWRPVLHRYIDYVSARVNGMGGNAATIPAAQSGYYPRRAERLATEAQASITAAPARSRVSSTIASATSKGSSSKRKRGRRAPSESSEPEVEALVRRAWMEGICSQFWPTPPSSTGSVAHSAQGAAPRLVSCPPAPPTPASARPSWA